MIAGRLKRIVLVVHRWLGVPLSLFFAIWFPSAIGMMYWDFPAVTDADRLARSAAIDPASITVSAARALASVHVDRDPAEIHLNTLDGRPVYRFRFDRDERVVFADTGEPRAWASSALIMRAAARWTGQPETSASVTPVTEADQWTVQSPLRTLRPLSKVSFPDGQDVYVAGATGEIVQYTTTASRIGAYIGPIPHWLYFTPLRKHQQTWTAVVVWSSAAATLAAFFGLVLGVWMSVPPARIPYRGQKRWHTVFGLVFGAGAVTWAFSGMMSMDPFPASTASAAPLTMRGRADLAAFTRGPREALALLSPARAKQLEWVSALGEPAYVATLEDGSTRVVKMADRARPTFEVEKLSAALAGNGARVSVLDHYDMHYLDRRHRKPLPVLHGSLSDGSDLYVDPATAEVVGTYSARDWPARWLYHGLHSLDFPWLYDRRPLWDVLVIAFMLGGTALSVTSVILAWRVVRRQP